MDNIENEKEILDHFRRHAGQFVLSDAPDLEQELAQRIDKGMVRDLLAKSGLHPVEVANMANVNVAELIGHLNDTHLLGPEKTRNVNKVIRHLALKQAPNA